MRKKRHCREKTLKGIKWFKKNGAFLKVFLECVNVLITILKGVFSSCILRPNNGLNFIIYYRWL